MRVSKRWGLGLMAAAGGMSACTSILGGFDFEGPAGTGGSGGTATSSTSSGGGSSSSASTSSSSGTGGAMACSPDTTQVCYGGPAGTEGKGLCVGGMETCNAQGTAYGGCAGEVLPKAETCASTDDEDCDGLDCVLWVIGLAGGNVTSSAANADGTIVVSGRTTAPLALGQVTLPTGNFIAKLKPDGMALWAIEGPPVAIAIDGSGNIFGAGRAYNTKLAGNTVPDGHFAFKLAPDGSVLWTKPYGGASGPGGVGSMAVTSDSDLIVGGTFALSTSNLDFGDGPLAAITGVSDTAYVAKLSGVDGAGTKTTSGQLWTLTFPGFHFGYGTLSPFVAAGGGGKIVVMMNFTGTVVVGGSTLTSVGGSDIGQVWLTSTGTATSTRMFGDADNQYVLGVSLADDGTVMFYGSFLGTLDPWSFGGGTPLASTSTQGGIFNELYGDGFVVALTNDNVRLAKAFGTAGRVTSAVMDSSGNIAVAGNFTGTANLGGGPLDGAQGTAVLLAKFKPDGSVFWQRHFAHSKDQALTFWPRLAVSPDGSSWVHGGVGTWPFDLGTGSLNTSTEPSAGFLARFAP